MGWYIMFPMRSFSNPTFSVNPALGLVSIGPARVSGGKGWDRTLLNKAATQRQRELPNVFVVVAFLWFPKQLYRLAYVVNWFVYGVARSTCFKVFRSPFLRCHLVLFVLGTWTGATVRGLPQLLLPPRLGYWVEWL